MNPIFWLEITKSARHVKHLSNHFILKTENKYMVFTSNPIPGLKSHLISASGNIVGNPKPQYLIEKVHMIDPVTHFVETSERGAIFYTKHKEIIKPILEKLSQ